MGAMGPEREGQRPGNDLLGPDGAAALSGIPANDICSIRDFKAASIPVIPCYHEILSVGAGETSMWSFLSSLFAAIPTAATSNAAFAAYTIAAVAYVLTMWRVVRNKNLLTHLRSLPPKDRLSALEMEMGGVRLSSGISPEQWVRSRIHKYYLIAFAISAFFAVCLVGLTLAYREGTVDVQVDLHQQSALAESIFRRISSLFVSEAHSAEMQQEHSEFVDPSSINSSTDRSRFSDPDEYTLRYRYSKDAAGIRVIPDLPYLTKLRKGEPVQGFSWRYEPFHWEFPSLAVKVLNNTRRDLLLTEVVIRVRESKLDNRPILVSATYVVNGLSIQNEGWGPVVRPQLQISLKHANACEQFSLGNPINVKLDSFDIGKSFSISPLVPSSLIDEVKKSSFANPPWPGYTPICVHGKLDFKDDLGNDDSFKFASIVVLELPAIAERPLPPTYTYDLFLKAGKNGYEERKSISQEIKPGAGDHFLIRISTDRSASFKFSMDIIAAGGAVVWTGNFDMSLLLPRSGLKYVAGTKQPAGSATPAR
jgi:hypothetical protein